MMNIDDDGKLKGKLSNKYVNAKAEGRTCNLSYENIVKLLNDAGIVSSQWNHKGYHLARYNDKGDYYFGNCRFITCKENYQEMKFTKEMRDAFRKNMIRENNSDGHGDRIKNGLEKSEKWQYYVDKIRLISKSKDEERRKNFHQSYIGKSNSQFGSFWITDGNINKKWRNDYGEIPVGFYRGRGTK